MNTETPGTVDALPLDSKLIPVAVVAWLWVLAPFSWGLYKLIEKINDLFG
jgi:hypothetical protein